MFSTVRYFIKTSVIFLMAGILTGLYLSLAKYVFKSGYGPELVSAHVHIILVGSVMMMIMGVALWFFPRPEKDDTKYNPDIILATYWIMTVSTALRFIFQVIGSFVYAGWNDYAVVAASAGQIIAMVFFFYGMWGRIRPVGSKIREARGEKF